MVWRDVTIGKLGRVVTGRTPPSSQPTLFGEAYPFITPTDIDGQERLVHTERFLSEEGRASMERLLVPAGSIAYVCIASVGKVCVVQRPSFTNQQINSVVVDEDEFDPSFVYYALRHATPRIKATAGGAATPIINKSAFSDISIQVPDLRLQRCIASILSAYDDLIENHTRRIAILEEMARRIYEEWFVRFRFPGHENVRMVESELGPVPDGWSVETFETLLDSWRGGDWGSDEQSETDSAPVFVIRGTDFDELARGTGNRTPRRFIEPKSLAKRKLRPYDLIVENSINAKSRSAGKTLLMTPGLLKRLGGDSIAASFCKVFRFKDPTLAILAHLKMRHLFECGDMAFYQNVAANGIANFQAQRFVSAQFMMLPRDEAAKNRLLSFLENLTASTLGDTIVNLRTTRDLLLPKLISGELDVSALPDDPEAVAA